MYDPLFDEKFSFGSKDTKWWDEGEPIWVTVQKHGLRSGVFFWPGSESVIRGLRPNIYKTYNRSIEFKLRVDTVVQWLSNSSFNIDLAMLYFNEPDHTGHVHGPGSQTTKDKVKEMDDILGYLVQKFDEADLWKTVNVLLTSDHGMAEVNYATRHIDLSNYIDMNSIAQMPDVGPVANILPEANMVDEIVKNLTGVDHLRVYKKENIPDHWHYKNNRRILPVLAVADEGWVILRVRTLLLVRVRTSLYPLGSICASAHSVIIDNILYLLQTCF
jgi:predicted AlkP superfamily pyrophosphatase or phosphodiesterase